MVWGFGIEAMNGGRELRLYSSHDYFKQPSCHHFPQISLGYCVEKHLYPNYLVVYIKWFKVVQFFRRNNIYASRIILLLITNALKPLINKGVLIPFVYFYPPNKVH